MSRSNSYVKTTWVDEETELSAAQLNRIEQGIYDAHDAIIAAEDALAATKANLIEEGTTDTAKKAVSDSLGRAIDATYSTKIEVNSALSTKADKTALDAKADNTTVNGIGNRVGALENEITDLQSVQNVLDIIATKSALNSYDTSKLEVNDKIQVISDETQGSASTIYNWNGSTWVYVGAYGTNSYTKSETLEQIDLHKLVNKTYSELATLKSGNNLVPGQLYRITDYVTKTNGKCNGNNDDVRSVEHPFDIIVRAISTNEFSENARAIQHTGDTYFANSKLEVWRLWYSFDNDTNRFEWADATTGKGVIYRMIDEFQNDVPYDFKNIQFKRYKITGLTDSRQNGMLGKYLGFYGNYNVTSDSTDYVWRFTFSKRADNSDLSLVEVNNSTFTSNAYVKQVVIGEYITDTPTYRCKQALNNIVMEVEALIVDVEMGKGSHHNTWIGNEDIDYCYFASMFRQNILFGEINHTRADECFEQNVIGEGSYSLYASCWNKFTHHFSQNIGINMQSNDFEGQVSGTKFPEHFRRNHISNMWNNVNASTHDTFNCCEFGYMVNVALSGLGDWDSVKTIRCYNVNIKITNFYGSNLGRMENVNISEGQPNSYNILNLTIGAINGSTSTPLTIDLTNLYAHRLTTMYEKKIGFAYNTALEQACLIYRCAVFNSTYKIIEYEDLEGIIVTNTGAVTWNVADSLSAEFAKFGSQLSEGLSYKMAKQNPQGTGTISMNNGTASGMNSYANGSGATASGSFSTAIGFGSTASGSDAVAIGGSATANDAMAHGNMAEASGEGSHALGQGTKAKGNGQMVFGKFNIADTTSLEIVGNGGYYAESNARLLDTNGDEYLAGDLYINTTFTKDSNKNLVSKVGTSVQTMMDNKINNAFLTTSEMEDLIEEVYGSDYNL